MSDSLGFDIADYQDQLNEYQSSLGKGLAAAAAINKSNASAVDKLNATVSESSRIVGEPLLAASTANLLSRATKALRGGKKAAADAAQEADNAGDAAADVTETSIDDAVSAANSAADTGGAVASATESGVDSVGAAASSAVEEAASAGTDGLGAASDFALGALSKVTKTAETVSDVSEGLESAGAAADIAAASEGGLNPIADVAALGIGLAVTLTGLFKKKHDPPAVVPPVVATPSFQFGV